MHRISFKGFDSPPTLLPSPPTPSAGISPDPRGFELKLRPRAVPQELHELGYGVSQIDYLGASQIDYVGAQKAPRAQGKL